MTNQVTTRKVLLCVCVLLCVLIVMFMMSQTSSIFFTCLHSSLDAAYLNKDRDTKRAARFDIIDNTGAGALLAKYQDLYHPKSEAAPAPANPNNPETIKLWWQAAAMLEWYVHTPIRYECKNKTAMGNWFACQDEAYIVKPPCLVYSFGINYDFSFDDAMKKLGCEVHSFDPSMNVKDHVRGNQSKFYNMGLSNINTDSYEARRDVYVKDRQIWKMRTVKSIMKMLGHENRVIDVFKMDIEAYEWGVLDNMMETDVMKHIRQFDLEYHLFTKFPLQEEYVFLYKTVTKFREMGFREYLVTAHPVQYPLNKFNNQGDLCYINAYFEKEEAWR